MSKKITSAASEPPNSRDPASLDILEQTDAKIAKQFPERAYSDASKSLVYRLSEAMFASLLASYIIGFSGVLVAIFLPQIIASKFTKTATPLEALLEISLRTAILFSVSMTFACLTATLYLNYNTGILTMASYNLKNARRDFGFAIMQGFLFGVTILWTDLLFFSVALILVVSHYIRWHEASIYLDSCLFEHIPKGRVEPDFREVSQIKTKTFEKIEELCKKHGFLDWRRPTYLELGLTGAALIGGICLAAYSAYDALLPPDPLNHSRLVFFRLLAAFSTLSIILVWSWISIGRAGEFFKTTWNVEDANPDEEYKTTLAPEKRASKFPSGFRYRRLIADIKAISVDL